MKLGNDTVGLRRSVTRLDGDGQPLVDDYGDELVDVVDVEVRWCLMTPTTRTTDTDEPKNRSAPMTQGMTLLAPASAGVTATDVVIWPITARAEVDGLLQLTGRLWQVDGEPGPWGEFTEARLQKAT